MKLIKGKNYLLYSDYVCLHDFDDDYIYIYRKDGMIAKLKRIYSENTLFLIKDYDYKIKPLDGNKKELAERIIEDVLKKYYPIVKYRYTLHGIELSIKEKGRSKYMTINIDFTRFTYIKEYRRHNLELLEQYAKYMTKKYESWRS